MPPAPAPMPTPPPVARPPQLPPGMPPGGMPIPPAPTPAPQPTPVVKKETPAQPATFAGSVRILAYSDAIVTGDGKAKASNLIDFDKIQAALKRVNGVTSASYDASSRMIDVGYSGIWTDINKLEMAVNNNGVAAELVSPAKVTFRSMVVIEDDAKVIAALKGVSGVQYVSRDNSDLYVYCDLSTTTLDSIRSACEGSGIRGMFASHEEVKVNFSAGNGNGPALQEDLSRTKWVLRVDIDSAANVVKVLAVKGRVTKALIKSLLNRHGFAEAK